MTLFALLATLTLAAQAPVAQPPADLEAKVEAVAETLRCVVCKNQSIADSDAGLAKDMKNLVRERLMAGDTEEEARAYLVERYGEYVLLAPRVSARNFGLWAGPLFFLVFGGALAVWFLRSRGGTREEQPVPLTPEERAELEDRLSTR